MTNFSQPFITVTAWNQKKGRSSMWTKRAIAIEDIRDIQSSWGRTDTVGELEALITYVDSAGDEQWIICSESFDYVIGSIRAYVEPIS